MSRDFDKTIVTCAATGSVHTPTLSPHLPVTPEEIIEHTVEAAEAGASIVHVHARDPETGKPSSDVGLYRKMAKGIKDQCDAIFCPTTGGSVDRTVEEAAKVVSELEPEMATCNLGSMNFGLYPMARRIDEFKYDWERDYLEGTKDMIFANTFEDLEKLFPIMQEAGTRPELECYDVGHIYNLSQVFRDGFTDAPLRIQFVMGILGGIGTHPSDLVHMKNTADRLFDDKYSWSVMAGGRHEFPVCSLGVSLGGDARVGMEDNLYLAKGQIAETNAQLVEKMVRIIKDVCGKEIATPDEAREFLELKGQDKVNF